MSENKNNTSTKQTMDDPTFSEQMIDAVFETKDNIAETTSAAKETLVGASAQASNKLIETTKAVKDVAVDATALPSLSWDMTPLKPAGSDSQPH